jgi:hypothetical protein
MTAYPAVLKRMPSVFQLSDVLLNPAFLGKQEDAICSHFNKVNR